jgi:hypothetical protein
MTPIAAGRPGLIALDVIFLAGGNPAAGQDQIVAARSRPQGLRQHRAIVTQDAEIAQLAAQPRQQRHQHETVGIEQLPGGTATARRHQFVAGGKHRDADAPFHIQMRQPERGGERDILWPQPAARHQRRMPRSNVLAGGTHIGAGTQSRR